MTIREEMKVNVIIIDDAPVHLSIDVAVSTVLVDATTAHAENIPTAVPAETIVPGEANLKLTRNPDMLLVHHLRDLRMTMENSPIDQRRLPFLRSCKQSLPGRVRKRSAFCGIGERF